MDYESIQLKKIKTVATIVLDRPEHLNALNVVMCNELLDAIKQCEWDEGIRVVVLTGTGKAFCSGGDVHDMRSFLTTHPSDNPGMMIEELITAVNRILLAIRKLKKPVIAALNGFCSGGGAGLAQACDIIIAAESAKLHVPNIRIGLVPDGGNSFFLVQRLGRHKAAELYFTAEPLDAHEAYRLGLLNQVVPDEELIPETEQLAEKLANSPRLAIGLAKSVLDMAAYNNLETQLEVEKEAVITCSGSTEFKEGIEAFFEKRKPDFIKF